MGTSTWVWVVVAALILFGAGAWVYTQKQAATAPQTQVITQTTGTQPQVSGAPMQATVVYSASGFSPSSITVAKGGTVTFVNQGGGSMWVASAPHPAHTGYDGTSRETHCATGYSGAKPFDQCAAGGSFSFTFTKTGTFTYHNHANAGMTSTVAVQ